MLLPAYAGGRECPGNCVNLPVLAPVNRLPDATVLGFQVSYPVGRAIRMIVRNPFAVGLALGGIFSAGVTGADVVFPFKNKSAAWIYAYAGFAIGPGVYRDGKSGPSGYVGFVWNRPIGSRLPLL